MDNQGTGARDRVYDTVVEIVAAFVQDKAILSSLSPSSVLSDDVDIDSARFVDIWLDVEERFGIAIPEEAMDKVKTLGDLTDTILTYSPAS